MKVSLTISVIAASLVLSGSAYAAGKCSTAPKSQWQSQAALKDKLVADGFKVSKIKTESGCFEVYATDKAGKRANMAFNAETLEKLDNAEAGEK